MNTGSLTHIRHLEKSDVKLVVDLIHRLHAESNFSEVLFDKAHCAVNVEQWINHNGYYVQGAFDSNKNIFAVYAGYITQYYFSKDLVAHDFLMYVEPERRGGYTIVRLVKNFESWAKSMGAKEIRPGTSTGIKSEMSKKLYEALGYKFTGHNFMKRS